MKVIIPREIVAPPFNTAISNLMQLDQLLATKKTLIKRELQECDR